MKAYSVIMVGGKGKRLWPVSSQGCSKTFATIGVRAPLICDTIKRIQKISMFSDIRFVVDKAQLPILKKTVKKVKAINIFKEPFGRNTASAIGYAAINLPKDSVMAVFPADAYVDSDVKFAKIMKRGIEFVKKNQKAILCIGVKPNVASIDYGYVQCGIGAISKIKRFIEKPNMSKAKKYLKQKDMLWNAGIFIFQTETILNAIAQHAPKLYKNLMLIKKSTKNLLKAYSSMDDVSIDYQIIEKYSDLYCLKADFEWSDIGTWKTFSCLFEKDKMKNVSVGCNKIIDGENVDIYGMDERKISVLGLDNLVVVSTKDGVLVCNKAYIDKIKDFGWI